MEGGNQAMGATDREKRGQDSYGFYMFKTKAQIKKLKILGRYLSHQFPRKQFL